MKNSGSKKKIYLLMGIISILMLGVRADEHAVPLSIQYCTDEINIGAGSGVYSELAAAIFVTESISKQYIGKSISNIAVGISHGSDEILGFRIFITKALGETPLYVQLVADGNIHEGWNSIKLDTPFELNGEALYIGYELESSGSPMGITTSDISSPNGSWIKKKNVWQQNKTKGNNCIKGIIDGYDIALNNIIIANKPRAYSPIPIKGRVVNGGGHSISEFVVSYKLDDGEFVDSQINIPNPILPGLAYEFIHTVPAIFTDGTHKLSVKASTIDTQPDVYTDNNALEIELNSVFTERYNKSILLEHFTTEQCQNCPGGHTYLSSIMGNNPSVVWVAHHSGFGTDKYTIPANVDMANFFKVNGAPMCILDREKDGGSPLYENMTQVTKEVIEQRIEEFSSVQVCITGTYDSDKRWLIVDVHYTLIESINNARLSLYLIEEKITTRSQAGATGLYTHAPLLRQTLSETFGDNVNPKVGMPCSEQYTFAIPETWNAENVKIVAFINEHNSNRIMCNVHNVTQVGLNDLDTEISYVSVSSQVSERTDSGIEVIGSGYYKVGDVVAIMTRTSPEIDTEHAPIFKNWTINGEVASELPFYTFTMGDKNIECVANYDPNPIGIEEIKNRFNIYIDRANDILNINGGDYNSLEMYDMSGKLILTESNRQRVDVGELKKGIYIVKLIDDNEVYTSKIIK